MALPSKVFTNLLQKSKKIHCCCGSNVLKPRNLPYSCRFVSKTPKNNSNGSYEKLLLGFGVASVTTSSAWLLSKLIIKPFDNVRGSALPTVSAAEPSPSQRWNFIADAVEKAAPAVVHITIRTRNPFTGQLDVTSSGSGFIIRSDGLIVTNAHVVAHKPSISVQLNDGSTYIGTVQAVDPVSDLATLKINVKDVPIMPLGQSSELRPGEWVIALGSPLQLSNTVTVGVVSTACRGSEELGLHHKDMEYIQTDAVINFGNSGGPLVNLDGEAIGVNSMKVTPGISFAIPSDYLKEFLKKAEKIEKRSESSGWFGGKSTVPKARYLGITMVTLTSELIKEIKLRQDFPDVQHGVLIHRVIVGSPADQGGLEPGDIIMKINSKDVRTSSDVYKAVENDEKLTILLQRGAKTKTLIVKPGESLEY